MAVLNCAVAPDGVSRIHDLLVCLAKIGETVGIEARPDKFTFTALNSSRTTYAAFSLDPTTFFIRYEFDGHASTTPGRFTCQLYNKILLSAFRSRLAENRNADTPVERCDISVEEDEEDAEDAAGCRIVVAMVCKHGLSKTHRLTYESVDVMHALFDRTAATGGWRIPAATLREYIEYFGPRTEQLDMLAKDGKAVFTSFTEKIMDGKEILKQPLETAISIHVEDFESFDFAEDMHIVISVKDFKAIVTHAATLRSATIVASFSRPTRPLQFTYEAQGLHCAFTLMTTGDWRSESASSTPASVAVKSPSRRPSAAVPGPSPPKKSDDAAMPPPAKPASIVSQIPRKGFASVQRGLSRTSQSQDPDSLFVPNETDEDRMWGAPDYENEEEEEQLGWDASGTQAAEYQPTLKDGGSHAASTRGTRSAEDGESQKLLATQRLSQLHGLFD